MCSIADDLALAHSPVTEEDLMVHVLSQLGDQYSTIVAAIKIHETPLLYHELFDKLLDFERALKEATSTSDSLLTIVNHTSTQQRHPTYRPNSDSNNSASRPVRFSNNNYQHGGNHTQSGGQQHNNSVHNTTFCQFCNIHGHTTRSHQRGGNRTRSSLNILVLYSIRYST